MTTTIDRAAPRSDDSQPASPLPARQPRRPSWHSRPIGYIPALDGMRAVAVALVIAYHLGYSGVAGGYIGVEVFFILSGWLVCALLMNEQQRTGGIALAGFWLRRARRLLPAMVAVIAGTLLVASVVDAHRLAELRTQAIAAVTYHLNWRLIFDQQSYFDAADGPSALEHLWSLSIEEQFYLLFPLLAAFVLAKRTRVSAVRLVLGLAVLSDGPAPASCTSRARDPSRIYFGTDTRLSGLLLGVALGLFWTPNRLRPHATRRFTVTMDLVAVAGALVIAWYAFGLDEHRAAAFQGGFTAVQLATLAVLAVAVYPAPTMTARLLSIGTLRWVGQRSYGIYLIHWPVIVFLSDAPGEQPENPDAESRSRWRSCSDWPPCRTGSSNSPSASAASGDGPGTRAIGWSTQRPVAPRWRSASWWSGSVAFTATVGVTREVVTASSPTATDPESVVIGPGEATTTTAAPTTTTAAADVPAPGSLRTTTTTAPPPPPPPPPAPVYASTTAIGDSVMVGAAPALANRMGPSLTVNAEVGRQLDEAAALVATMAADGTLGRVVLVNLGTNGPFTPEQIDALFAAAGPDRRVLLVNVVVPRRWEAEVNDQLAAAAGRHPNAVLVDWRTLATTEPGLLRDDGFHVTPNGAERYTDLVVGYIPTA